jgi:hypothetical protein
MPNPVDVIFHGLFSAVDPLGMVLRTLMALLSDALAQVSTDMYRGVFDATTVDFDQTAVGNIWRITTGLSAALATILLVIAAFRSMLAQSTRFAMAALPGVVLAIVGPQALTVLLPAASVMFTSLANTIVTSATPDLAASIRLLAGVGDNALYEGLGLLAPVIAALLLFGLTTVFFVLMFCMVAAVVLYVLSPFAFAGLVMAPTRAWFTKWATAMFSVLFVKVPIAILLALSVSLFANSDHAGITQSFANATAGLILGIGALLAPLMGYGLFSFMSTVAVRPSIPTTNPSQAIGSTYYGAQMGKSSVNAMRSAVDKTRSTFTTANSPSLTAAAPGRDGAPARAPTRAADDLARTGSSSASGPAGSSGSASAQRADAATPGPPTAAGAGRPTTGGAAQPATAGTAGTAGSATAGGAVAAGAATAGVGAVAVVAAKTGKKATGAVKSTAAATAAGGTTPAPDAGSSGSAATQGSPRPQVDGRRTT